MTGWDWIVLGVGVVGLVVGVSAYRWSQRKVEAILDAIRCDDARIQTRCMVRWGGYEGPGVAQVVEDRLVLITPLEARLSVPLSEVSVRKEGRWWGEGLVIGWRAFHLETPQTRTLVLGVEDPEPWREIFRRAGRD